MRIIQRYLNISGVLFAALNFPGCSSLQKIWWNKQWSLAFPGNSYPRKESRHRFEVRRKTAKHGITIHEPRINFTQVLNPGMLGHDRARQIPRTSFMLSLRILMLAYPKPA